MTLVERWARMTSGVPPFEGTDKRVNRWLAAFFEWMLFFRSKAPAPFLTLEILGIRIGIPWKLPGEWGYFLLRVHVLRFDFYNSAYLGPSAMLKRVKTWEILP